MKAEFNIGLFACFLIWTSCSKGPSEFSDAGAYSDFIKNPENSLRKVKNMGTLDFSIQYKTIEYSLIEEQHLSPENSNWNELEKELAGSLQFTFRISSTDGTDPLTMPANLSNDYSSRLEYFSFQAQNDFYLLNGNDTLPCKNFLFERSYGMSPHMTFLMAFDTIPVIGEQGFNFVYNDRAFGKGPIQFHYSKETLMNIPKLI